MSRRSSTLLYFLAGAAAGAVLGILYAPDKGKNTREKLSQKLGLYREQLKEYIDKLTKEHGQEVFTEAKTEGQKVINDAKVQAEQLLQDVEELISQIATKKS
jgi:gas vesicle protein